MADLERYPAGHPRLAKPVLPHGTNKQLMVGCVCTLGTGVLCLLIGSLLEAACGFFHPSLWASGLKILAIALLYTGPVIAWVLCVEILGPNRTKKFRQGMPLGAIGFYTTLVILLACFVGGVH